MSKHYSGVCHGLIEGSGLSCQIEVGGSGLTVTEPQRAPFVVPFLGMTAGFMGVNDRYLSLRTTVDGRELQLLIPDKAVIADIAAAGAPGSLLAAMRHVEQARGRRRRLRLGVFGSLALILALLVAVVIAALGYATDKAVELVPPEWESTLGRTVAEGLLTEKQVCTDLEVTRATQEIGLRLVSGLGATPYNFRIRVLDDPEVNAFALPGGYVFVNRGLLDAAGDGDEVAGVLAHEIEHVRQRHGVANLVRQAGMMLALSVLVGDVGAVEQLLLRNAASLMDMSFSRDQESAADAGGVALMAKAGLDPRGLSRFLAQLAEKEGAAGVVLSIVSTHPASVERSQDLEARVAGLGAVPIRPLTSDFAALKGKCGPVSISDPDSL